MAAEAGGTIPTRDELTARAAALAPGLLARADETEALRRIPDATIAELRDAGLWRILRPVRFGGIVTDFGCMVDVAAALARGCASTAWVYINIISHNWMLPYWPRAASEEVWGENREALIGSTLVFPAGRLEPAPGGWRFSGRWPFASGIDASDWMMLGAMAPGEDGRPSPRIAVVRARDLAVHDTWHVAGLAGTGSKDVACDGLFVPAHRVWDPALARDGWAPGTEALEADAYRLPLIPFVPHLIAGPMLGIAEGALEDWLAGLRDQVSTQNRSRLAEHTTLQLKLAEAGVLVDGARLLLREGWREAHAIVAAGKRPTAEQRLRWRRDAAHAAGACVRAVDLAWAATGAAANRRGHELQRRFRDIHAARHQIHVSFDIDGPDWARAALGLPTTNALL
ncbi:MAG: acyl-CoA dehydrogenase family protein [Alphaproteobacteria bacterium]